VTPSVKLKSDFGGLNRRGTTQDKLARRLRGDLDAIVLKALEKRPEDRYSSAASLADDLQRYLAGEPVKARPDTSLYRLSRFVARHRVAVPASTAAAVLIAVLGGYGLTHRPKQTGPQEASRAASSPAVTDKSIAVLPFVDMSEKHDQE
jgi:hypothetical protein